MHPLTTLEIKAPGLLWASVRSRIVLQCWIIFHRYSQWTVAFPFFKRICYVIQQYVPFVVYARILFPTLVQKWPLFLAIQTKTTQIFWQVAQWALDRTTFDFICDSCHRRLWCLWHSFSWSCFILWMMHLSLSDWPLHQFQAFLACYLCLSLVKTQYFNSLHPSSWLERLKR